VAHVPHHVIQRGNRRQKVFFVEEDKRTYLDILKLQAKIFGLEIWAYCLMDNHVHLIVVPKLSESLVKGIGGVHEMYTRMINFREGWRGYLWEGRFKSVPLDERHCFTVMRYVERNPVRARMVLRAEDYKWSSARAHVAGVSDGVVSDCYLTQEIQNGAEYLGVEEEAIELKRIRRHSETGRPLGADRFLHQVENKLGRAVMKQKPGPRKKVWGR